MQIHHHHHHVRVAGEGCCVTPVPWPRRTADLHHVEGMLPVSLRIWSTHLLFGRPGRRFQSRSGRWPRDRSTWARRAWWAGTSSPSLAVWPKIAIRRLASYSPTDARPGVWWDHVITHQQVSYIPDSAASCWYQAEGYRNGDAVSSYGASILGKTFTLSISNLIQNKMCISTLADIMKSSTED